MKRWICIMLVCALFLPLAVACASEDYRTDVGANSLMTSVQTALGAADGDYFAADGDVYSFYFSDEEAFDCVNDCEIFTHKDTLNVNEFGVFRCASENDRTAVAAMVQLYVDGQVDYLRGFAQTYNPDEVAKIDNAGVILVGVYVFYYILSPTDEQTAINALKSALKK